MNLNWIWTVWSASEFFWWSVCLLLTFVFVVCFYFCETCMWCFSHLWFYYPTSSLHGRWKIEHEPAESLESQLHIRLYQKKSSRSRSFINTSFHIQLYLFIYFVQEVQPFSLQGSKCSVRLFSLNLTFRYHLGFSDSHEL